MLHYKGHTYYDVWQGKEITVGCYFQSQILLTQFLFDTLYGLGFRYVRIEVKSIDVYGNTSMTISPNPVFVEMHRVNIWGFPFTTAQLSAGSEQHIIVKVEISFKMTNNG